MSGCSAGQQARAVDTVIEFYWGSGKMRCSCYSRRKFLGALGSVVLCSGAPLRAASAAPLTCAALSTGNIDTYPRRAFSDNPKLDDAVINELKRILAVIPVDPQFQYIQEDQPNAFAMRTSDVLAWPQVNEIAFGG